MIQKGYCDSLLGDIYTYLTLILSPPEVPRHSAGGSYVLKSTGAKYARARTKLARAEKVFASSASTPAMSWSDRMLPVESVV